MARNIEKGAFRTPPSHQNRRRRMVGQNDSSKNGAIMYDCVEIQEYIGNVG